MVAKGTVFPISGWLTRVIPPNDGLAEAAPILIFASLTDSLAVAEKLLHVQAVRLNLQQPFTWAEWLEKPDLLR